MTEELEDIKEEVEEAIIMKNEKSFFIAYAKWQDIVYHPDFPFFVTERVFEEGWEKDAKKLGWYATTEEFTEKLLEAAKLTDTSDYKLRTSKKEIDKAIKMKDISELADLVWIWSHSPIDIAGEVLHYLYKNLKDADLDVLVDNEYIKKETAYAEKEDKRAKKEEREKEKELYKYRPPSRREVLKDIKKLELVRPIVFPSVGTCEYCHKVIEPGVPYYKDEGKVFHRECAIKVFPDRKWHY